MTNIFTDVFDKILAKFGYERASKTVTETDFYEVNDISLTSVMAESVATMCLADSSVSVDGTSTRAKAIGEIAKNVFSRRGKTIISTALGTGDCLLVPVTNGKRYAIDVIENRDFAIFDSLGDYLYGVVMKRDEFVRDGKKYERFESQSLKEDIEGKVACFINQIVYINGKEVDIATVDVWQNIPPEQYIPNVDRLMLGRIKCPTLNRENVNSVHGVPITYGLSKAVERAKESYVRYNDEFKKKQTKIFADKKMFKKKDDDSGDYYIPDGGLYQWARTGTDGQLPIKDFSPTLQHEALQSNVEFNFKLLEMFAGFSTGILSDVDVTLETATAIRASLQKTFAYITITRSLFSEAFDDLLYAISMMMNKNGDASRGEFTVSYDWSDKLMESSTETFNALLQSKGIGAVSTAEIRSWVMNEKLSQSEQWVADNPQETIQEDLLGVV